MPYEVELKFPLTDKAALLARLQALGAEESGERRQSDAYYNHPIRDFAATDEALRVRADGDRVCFTYKGPKIDSETKTRREVEVHIHSTPEHAGELLQALGFNHVAEVRKSRRCFRTTARSAPVELTIDSVDALGEFVEIELVVTQDEEIPAARDSLLALAKKLGLSGQERRGYLEMLLAQPTDSN
ncbi:MAG: class IV adenylate cyclase [Planctomycetota bacterium]